MAVGGLYVRQHFEKATKEEAVEMARNILASFKKMLEENDWMDPETKSSAVEKVRLLDLYVQFTRTVNLQ